MDHTFLLQALSLLFGFYMAWNIGANDVANAMGTSVGSKALTLAKAVLLAAILEFSGAFFAGGAVSETLQKGILPPETFAVTPHVFVLGMLSALLATGVLLQIASYFGLPVSTTHAIVGAVTGFGALIGGIQAVAWDVVAKIALSWVLSPLLSGFVAYALFRLIQHKILDSSKPLESAKRWLPIFVFACAFVLTLSFLYQGLVSLELDLSFRGSFLLATGAGGLGLWISQRLSQRVPALAGAQILISKDEVEKNFVPLQILSASLVAFAHGANDVANAIGPVAAILSALKNNTLSMGAPVPMWLLGLGGSGIVLGLATWGWRVIETIGKKITELTPTRGFAAEFGAAATILLASKLGLPISTTHALVGAIFGVGIARGMKALNLHMIREIILSWIVTIPLCAALCVGIFYALKIFF